jgi:hypothetical protein
MSHEKPAKFEFLPVCRNILIKPLAQSVRSEVGHVPTEYQNSSLVFKIDRSPRKKHLHESQKKYRQRLYNSALERIKKKKEEQALVSKITNEIAQNVRIPKEEWFICVNKDKLPNTARIQEEIKGTLLRNRKTQNLTKKQLETLVTLLDANEQCWKITNKHIDLIGSLTNDNRIKRIFEKFNLGILSSVNIIITDNGEIVLIDGEIAPNSGITNFAKRVGFLRDKAKLRKLINSF